MLKFFKRTEDRKIDKITITFLDGQKKHYENILYHWRKEGFFFIVLENNETSVAINEENIIIIEYKWKKGEEPN